MYPLECELALGVSQYFFSVLPKATELISKGVVKSWTRKGKRVFLKIFPFSFAAKAQKMSKKVPGITKPMCKNCGVSMRTNETLLETLLRLEKPNTIYTLLSLGVWQGKGASILSTHKFTVSQLH